MNFTTMKKTSWALAGVAQWIECQPANLRVARSIPSEGTCLGCRLCPQLGAHERQPHIAPLPRSLPLSPPLSPSLPSV